MATVVNKTTFEVIRSVHTPDFPTADWLINPPGLAALEAANVPTRYWKVVGTDVAEQTAGEKAATDSDPTQLSNARRQRLFELERQVELFVDGRYGNYQQQQLTRMSAEVSIGALPLVTRRGYLAPWLAWLGSISRAHNTAKAAVAAAATVPLVQAVTLDLTPFVATDPGVNAETASALS